MNETDSDIYYVGLRGQIAAFWPQDLLPLPNLDVLDSVWIAPSTLTSDEQQEKLTFETTLLFEQALRVDLGFVVGLSLILGEVDLFTPVHLRMTLSDVIDPDPETYAIEIGPLPVTLFMAGDLFKRMEDTPDGFVEAPPDPDTGEPQPMEVLIGGAEFSVNSNSEFTFAVGSSDLVIQPFMIGHTGVIIEATGSLILSAEAAQALPDSIPVDWRGVFLEQATIHLPEGLNGILPDDVTLEDFFIGSGGFCGKVTGNLTSDV
jgi:hypothetical protein